MLWNIRLYICLNKDYNNFKEDLFQQLKVSILHNFWVSAWLNIWASNLSYIVFDWRRENYKITDSKWVFVWTYQNKII